MTFLIDRIANDNTVSDVNENYGNENDYATLQVEIMHKIFITLCRRSELEGRREGEGGASDGSDSIWGGGVIVFSNGF